MKAEQLREQMGLTCWAFRGYNVTNLGRTPELLAHDAYGDTVAKHLREAAAICAEATGRHVDLVERVEQREETSLDTYAEALALIVATELAQLELLEQFFGIDYRSAHMQAGYSLGEISAVIASGVFSFEAALTPLLKLAPQAADLAGDVTMGVLFSRGPALDFQMVERRCLEISSEGQGMIAISTYLSPNTVLLLGQHDTVDCFRKTMKDHFTERIHIHKNDNHWPPIHTPLVWHRNVPNQAGVMLANTPGGFKLPSPPLYSCVTGGPDYTELNVRDILMRWVDHPQQLWKVIHAILEEGIERVIHLGPEPNIVPATLTRLASNVTMQLSKNSLSNYGLRAISSIIRRRPWLQNLLSSDATLLRAPFIEQVNAEDWLLDQAIE